MTNENCYSWLILKINDHTKYAKPRLMYYPVHRYDSKASAETRIKHWQQRDEKLGVRHMVYVAIPFAGGNMKTHCDKWMSQYCYEPDEDVKKDSMEQNLYNRNGLTGHGLAAASLDVSKQQETIMSIQVSNPTLINGRGEDSFSVDDLIGLIRDSEKQIGSLEGVNTESKTVKALIKREQDGIAAIVKILDSREI